MLLNVAALALEIATPDARSRKRTSLEANMDRRPVWAREHARSDQRDDVGSHVTSS